MRRLLPLVFAIGVPACGNDSPTAPPAPPPTTLPSRSAITITADPNPVIAGPGGTGSNGVSYPFSARWTLVITETAGLPCNVNRVLISFFPTDDSAIEYNPADITRLAGTNFVAASGSLRVPISILYRGSASSRLATFVSTVEVIDANNNRLTGSVNVDIR